MKAFQIAQTFSDWRLSMSAYYVGLRIEKNKDEKRKYFDQGYQAGLSSLKVTPECGRCHFWTAINLALRSEDSRAQAFLGALGEIRDHLKESMKYEPAYAGGGAHRLLGIIDMKMPGILGGSDERAKAHFESAISESPDEPLNICS
ncbi:MAG: hypothetical protein KA715_11275 [Xanthomonadaceae bacterium]|nr:hypothetical protein [Xanthomonadaceae bacterium]